MPFNLSMMQFVYLVNYLAAPPKYSRYKNICICTACQHSQIVMFHAEARFNTPILLSTYHFIIFYHGIFLNFFTLVTVSRSWSSSQFQITQKWI